MDDYIKRGAIMDGGAEMRLIDADTCPELFDEEYRKTRQLIEQGEEHLDNLAEGFTEAHHVIQRIPTIEAEPVKHGRWVEAAGGRTICNQCGEYPLYDYFGRLKLSTACPNCGAKMDGGSDNV